MIKNFNSSCSRIANLTVSGAVSTSKTTIQTVQINKFKLWIWIFFNNICFDHISKKLFLTLIRKNIFKYKISNTTENLMYTKNLNFVFYQKNVTAVKNPAKLLWEWFNLLLLSLKEFFRCVYVVSNFHVNIVQWFHFHINEKKLQLIFYVGMGVFHFSNSIWNWNLFLILIYFHS